ncbi:MAG TPA: hypothetical protein VKD28_15140 [Gemmatimonadales bacterium]|nr:hypothetical protein [Gemmatimonadales bacterium]
MRRPSIVVVAILATACASKTATTTNPTPVNPPAPPAAVPPPPPAPPPAVGGNAIRIGPSTLRYVMHQRIQVDQQLPTGRQQVSYGISAFFRATIVGPADSSGYPLTVSIDSIAPDSGTTVPLNTNLASAKGLSYRGRLTPRGEFRNAVPSDSATAQAISPVVGSFQNFYPRLPASGLTLGATWTDTLTTSDRGAGNVTVKSINSWRAPAWEDRNGVRCLRVEVASTFTIEGKGEQLGQPFEVAGTGVRNGVDYLAVDGRYLGGESNDSTSMTITLPVQTMTIPRTQVSKTTVTVLP